MFQRCNCLDVEVSELGLSMIVRTLDTGAVGQEGVFLRRLYKARTHFPTTLVKSTLP